MKNLLMTKSSDCKSDLVKGSLQDGIKVLINKFISRFFMLKRMVARGCSDRGPEGKDVGDRSGTVTWLNLYVNVAATDSASAAAAEMEQSRQQQKCPVSTTDQLLIRTARLWTDWEASWVRRLSQTSSAAAETAAASDVVQMMLYFHQRPTRPTV